jgi:hypothetical protein
VLPVGAGDEVGGQPAATADAGVDASMAGEVGRQSRGGIPSDTSEEYYQTELS